MQSSPESSFPPEQRPDPKLMVAYYAIASHVPLAGMPKGFDPEELNPKLRGILSEISKRMGPADMVQLGVDLLVKLVKEKREGGKDEKGVNPLLGEKADQQTVALYLRGMLKDLLDSKGQEH